jgi:hypothetical protein
MAPSKTDLTTFEKLSNLVQLMTHNTGEHEKNF